MRLGVRAICAGISGVEVIADVKTAGDAVALCRAAHPNVIVMDPDLPGRTGVDAIGRIIRDDPSARVIALTMRDDDAFVLDTVRAGVRAFLPKTIDAATLIDAVSAVHRGEYLIDPVLAARVMGDFHQHATLNPSLPVLLEKEMAVLRLLAEGLDNRDIAATLGCSEHVVSNRLRTIFGKLRVSNRTQAALYAYKFL